MVGPWLYLNRDLIKTVKITFDQLAGRSRILIRLIMSPKIFQISAVVIALSISLSESNAPPAVQGWSKSQALGCVHGFHGQPDRSYSLGPVTQKTGEVRSKTGKMEVVPYTIVRILGPVTILRLADRSEP